MKRKTATLALSMLMAFICAISLISAGEFNISGEVPIASSTYYYYKYVSKAKRDKLTTSVYSNTTSTSGKKILAAGENTSKKNESSISYSYTETKTSSVSLGVGVPIGAITAEAGGSVSYSTSRTISATATIKPSSTVTVSMATRTTRTKYKSVIQYQQKFGSSWLSLGSSSKKYSTVTKTYPVIYIED